MRAQWPFMFVLVCVWLSMFSNFRFLDGMVAARTFAADTIALTMPFGAGDVEDEPEIINISTSCRSCNDSRLCSNLFVGNNSNLVSDCLANPQEPQCRFGCVDMPSTFSTVSLRNNTTTGIWPPLDQGRWVEDPVYCQAFQNTTRACLLNRYRWNVQQDPSFSSFDPTRACSLLHQLNISNINIVGDSLGRHVWQGFLMSLTGNYQNSFGRPECAGALSFSEKDCRIHAFSSRACPQNNVSILVNYGAYNPRKQQHTPPIVSANINSWGSTLHLYSVGNHPARGKHSPTDRLEILNVSAYRQHKWYDFEKPHFWGHPQDLFLWIPPHYKMYINRHDETNERGLAFLLESHEFFAASGAHTVNTYTLTRHAVPFFCKGEKDAFFVRETCEPTLETWDGYHYGRDISLWKSHLILHRLQQLLD